MRWLKQKPPRVFSIGMAAATAALCHSDAARASGPAASAAEGSVEPAAAAPQTNESEPAEEAPARLSGGAIFGAVALSLWPGFGAGHAMIGEYGNTGWMFTAGELASMGALVGGIAICDSAGVDRQARADKCDSQGTPLALLGLGAFGVLRALEIASVLLTVSGRDSPRGDARDAAALEPAVYALPGGGGVALGGRF